MQRMSRSSKHILRVKVFTDKIYKKHIIVNIHIESKISFAKEIWFILIIR